MGFEGELDSPYAETKLAGEKIAEGLSSIETKFVCLRFFNVYGKGQPTDSGYSAVIPSFIQKTINGDDMVIYGDGRQVRDFVHVADVSKAIIGALENEVKNFEIINVGTGMGTKISELAEKIKSYSIESGANNPGILYEPSRDGDLAISIADISGMEKLVDVEKLISLENGLREQFFHDLMEIRGK